MCRGKGAGLIGEGVPNWAGHGEKLRGKGGGGQESKGGADEERGGPGRETGGGGTKRARWNNSLKGAGLIWVGGGGIQPVLIRDQQQVDYFSPHQIVLHLLLRIPQLLLVILLLLLLLLVPNKYLYTAAAACDPAAVAAAVGAKQYLYSISGLLCKYIFIPLRYRNCCLWSCCCSQE